MENIVKPSNCWYKKWWGILIIIIIIFILSVLIAFSFLVASFIRHPNNNNLNTSVNSQATSTNLLINGDESNYWTGSADPKVTIVEFGDFSCAHCKESYPTIMTIANQYKNDIKFIFRDYPVISDDSLNLALAARCTGEQGKFWLMYNMMFENQGKADFDTTILANQTGIDMVKYNNCVNYKKYYSNIEKDFNDGKTLGVTGTPTWFVNGRRVEGNVPYDTFIKIINGLIIK
jgi:protein-disulfide isomerase